MTCESCKDLVDIEDTNNPYVVHTCPKCSRKIKLRSLEIMVTASRSRKGDQFVFPKGWLQISANPLKGKGNLLDMV